MANNNDPSPLYLDPAHPVEARLEDLLARMTLAEKIGQITQVEKNSISPENVTKFYIGSLLSGGGGYPSENTVPGWAEMVRSFQQAALQTRLAIPMIYGIDAVHGHTNLIGATVFPHNIGLGAANHPELVRRIARATAHEMLATGIPWNFAPALSIPQDIRWGRTYEGFSEDKAWVTPLATAYLEGLQSAPPGWHQAKIYVLATPKHFIGDGATTFGTSTTVMFEQPFIIDQGDTRIGEADLRSLYLPPYQAAIDAGALSVMASFNSWNGDKLHAHHYLLTEVLKGELGFEGFIVSDWEALNQLSDDYSSAVVASINAGVDMVMTPFDYQAFITTLAKAVEQGHVSPDRIDDAVRRILRAKFTLGLFERPFPDPALQDTVGSQPHRQLAREAVRRSLVLLKNERQTLPIPKDTPQILVAGEGADDIGLQCGGWTIEWQGKPGPITPGTTILQGIRAAVSPAAQVIFNPLAQFDEYLTEDGSSSIADLGIAVISEAPYAEGFGDREDLNLPPKDADLIAHMRERCQKLVVILLSGRPIILTNQLPAIDALVAAWLPGSECDGLADVLFGDFPFEGKLPFTWPRHKDQLPLNLNNAEAGQALFPLGFGLQ